MDAVILKTGVAVKTSNLEDYKCDINGFLYSFKINSKKYSYYTTKDTRGVNNNNINLKKINGYYEDAAYTNFIYKPTQLSFDELIAKCFDDKFIVAETDDKIIIKIVYIGEPPIGYYFYRKYDFNHIKGKNYLKRENELDTSLLGTPSAPLQINGTEVSKGFYNNHIAQLPSIIETDRFQYSLYTVKCAIKIENIESDIFPILLYNSSNISLLNVTSLISELKSHWKDKMCYEKYTLPFAIYFYEILKTFYTACFKNQILIEKSYENDRMKYLIQALPTSVAAVLPVSFRITVLKSLVNKNGLEESDIDTINKIVMSFNENDFTKIDDFLDNLVSINNSSIIDECFRESDGITIHKRNKITLYEKIYRILSEKNNRIKKIWEYSPLYKKLHSSLNIQEEVSSLQLFVTSVYNLWILSKYNPYKNGVFNENLIGYKGENEINKKFIYTRKAASKFTISLDGFKIKYHTNIDHSNAPLTLNINKYLINTGILFGKIKIDSIKTVFAFDDKILIGCNDINNFPYEGVMNSYVKHYFNTTRFEFYSYGYYHIYQPIQIINNNTNQTSTTEHSWDNNGQTEKVSYMPAFLFHFLQERQEDEFLYSLLWRAINIVAEIMPEGKLIKLIKNANEKLNNVLDIYNELVPKTIFQFINAFCLNCDYGDDFCEKIKNFNFWLQNYISVANRVITIDFQKSAQDIVLLNDWPTDFNIGDGLAAKNFIAKISQLDVSNSENDRKNNILTAIKKRIAREEPISNPTTKAGFSLKKWTKELIVISPKRKYYKYTYTGEIWHTDAIILEMITYGLSNKVPDHWIEGIVTKAFRMAKPKTQEDVKLELLNASNLKKPLPAPGRNHLLYCFHDANEQTIFEQKVKQQYIDKYGIFDVIATNGKLTNTYYGGSVHTKLLPPDIDMVSYITDAKMQQLANIAIAEFKKAEKEQIKDESFIEKKIANINRSMTSKPEEPNNIRVMAYQIPKIVEVGGVKRLHYMSNEYRSPNMKVTINGVNKNILKHLNLSSPLYDKFDFVFITQKAAVDGRSMPPETPVEFD